MLFKSATTGFTKNYSSLTFRRFSLLIVALLTLTLLAACGDATATTAPAPAATAATGTTSAATTSASGTATTSAATGNSATGSSTGDSSVVLADAKKDTKPFRIGYQKGGTLALIKSQGTVEKLVGGPVQWVEFTAGPPLLEALNAGSIDIGSTGNAPPVFAQAGGNPLLYVASEQGDPTGQGILVPGNSPIKTVADLKGKKVAYNPGSSAHYLFVKALQEAGLQYTDVTSVGLSPADARVAFETGKVDAWVIWDPYFTVALHSSIQPRVIRDSSGLGSNRSYYLATPSLVKDRTNTLKAFLTEVQRADVWSQSHRDETAQFVAPQIGVDLAIEKEVTARARFNLTPMDDLIVADQQGVADLFLSLKLIPKKDDVSVATWKGSWPAPAQ